MGHEALVQASSGDGGTDPALIAILCLFLVMGLVRVVRPRLLWRLDSRMQRGWVKNPEATEPTGKGYALHRVTGVLFLAVATWMLVERI
ncbi:DUF6199 family natural product biosynthesis protein [Streptomyces sp. NPDC093586]|uniref:DUF6199 family natural product biosynthesis protein n=1 Tax=Streptomyces sp. NPDC093586 TaxID=3366042 RepID=UPI0037FB0C4B